mmetsp:Transcript_6916/g.26698  ORF Transcript_6916/g.26698 Transcript_6916/m.26698 type:complete len:226 (-) Transcript_6916:168-845(-)
MAPQEAARRIGLLDRSSPLGSTSIHPHCARQSKLLPPREGHGNTAYRARVTGAPGHGARGHRGTASRHRLGVQGKPLVRGILNRRPLRGVRRRSRLQGHSAPLSLKLRVPLDQVRQRTSHLQLRGDVVQLDEISALERSLQDLSSWLGHLEGCLEVDAEVFLASPLLREAGGRLRNTRLRKCFLDGLQRILHRRHWRDLRQRALKRLGLKCGDHLADRLRRRKSV